jgi:hypothetical protein
MQKNMFLKIVLPSLSLLIIACSTQREKVSITETDYQDRPHFQITTPAATYKLDKSSAGFSSITDAAKKEWIGFESAKDINLPGSAENRLRGLPSLFPTYEKSEPGHPSNALFSSQMINDSTIKCSGNDGLFEVEYTFYKDFFTAEVNGTDPSTPYCFSYQGIIGGSFSPNDKYWGTNAGLRTENPDLVKEDTISENMEWAFLGDKNQSNVLFIKHKSPDYQDDIFGFMGNSGEGLNAADGMTVLSFGRNTSNEALLSGRNTFYVGFFNQKVSNSDDFFKLFMRIESLPQ